MGTLAAFLEVVGLTSIFVNERRASAQDKSAATEQTIEDYLEWLRRHDHQEIVELIQGNASLTLAIQSLLVDQHAEVIAKLTDLDRVLSSVASHLADFKPLADSLGISSQMSNQAVGILRQMNQIGASKLIESTNLRDGKAFAFSGGGRGSLQIDDPRFIEDDISTLCELGLLRISYNSKGNEYYVITRSGAVVGANDA